LQEKIMVEVFKTNVADRRQAGILLREIRKRFSDYAANFDLQDCDRVLRVKCVGGCIHSSAIIKLVGMYGFNAEVLSDQEPITTSRRELLGFAK
jgi:hypothetical protein